MGNCEHADERTSDPERARWPARVLEHQRQAVRNATYGLREDQARFQPTPSALTLGGLVKHLTQGERDWSDHIAGAPSRGGSFEDYMAGFALSERETLTDVLEQYQEASTHTDSVFQNVEDLGRRVRLPQAPWFPDPEGCTVRWILLHLVEETARTCWARRHHSRGSRRSPERAADGSGGRMARSGVD